MTTKVVKTRRNGKANATVKKEVKAQLTQKAIELEIQNLNIEKIIHHSNGRTTLSCQ